MNGIVVRSLGVSIFFVGLGCLLLLVDPHEPAGASEAATLAPCCQECEVMEAACYDECESMTHDQGSGDSLSSCMDDCDNDEILTSCYSNCYYCSPAPQNACYTAELDHEIAGPVWHVVVDWHYCGKSPDQAALKTLGRAH